MTTRLPSDGEHYFLGTLETNTTLFHDQSADAFTIKRNTTGKVTLSGINTLDLGNGELDNIGSATNSWTANSIVLDNANAGLINEINLRNSSTSASSRVRILMRTVDGSGSTADNMIDMRIVKTGDDVIFMLGIDDSLGGFVINRGGTFGASDALRITDASTPVVSLDTTLGGAYDYVCDECGKHEVSIFTCCGKVEWHDDVNDYRSLALGESKGLDYMEKVGVMYRSLTDSGKPEVWTNIAPAIQFGWSMAWQNRQYIERLETKMSSLEKALGV